MKVTGKASLPATFSGRNPTDADLKPTTKRKARNRRWKRVGGTPVVGRRSRPETPLLKWKVEEREKERGKEKGRGVEEELEDEVEEEENGGRRGGGRGHRRKGAPKVSARKLAAGLWLLQLPETVTSSVAERRSDRLGFKIEPSIQFSNSAMEGATKWDPVCLKTTDEVRQIYNHMKRIDQQVSAVSIVSALEAELEQARAYIEELETERRSSKKKLEHFLRKVSEERAAWRSREHEKIRAFVDDVKADLNREKKKRQRLEIVNSKLVNELAAAKLSAKQYMQDYEKERKARELIEEVCDELAKEIGEDKAEVEAIKRDSMKLREEVDEERKMLQMAEVWREERVQMKLIDAKVALEERYSQMNKLIADLETFLRSRTGNLDTKDMQEAESLREAAESVNVKEIKEFTYEPANPDDIFAVFEDVAFGEANEREIEPFTAYSPASHASKVLMVSPEMNMMKKDSIMKHSNALFDQNDEIEEDESGWETVSHLEDQGSSYSPKRSAASVTRNHRDSNFSGSGTEWEENACGDTPITEISEVCSLPARQSKKASSITRLWRSCPNNGENYKTISVEGANGRLSNGRKSNGGIVSPDRGSGKGGLSPSMGQWSSPDSGHPHITKGMKGCIDWPRGAQKNSLKAKLLEARMESQKVQLRHVLKQKI
ncbi:probable DNA double-strand break repair Rad50 ATPase isoform X2 [Gossypium hirsutum]|uniref:Probable DNA double-strand break repair Rad50 ATPase isoform X2 n=1 Tax=Gossypium hirsutum TaxID=3635 RepID=A0ABM2ZJU1_GOSHI|nr:probable DNA double-strand break repair Rad50 ATPase isoform X2 [Gossypium hirsutum]